MRRAHERPISNHKALVHQTRSLLPEYGRPSAAEERLVEKRDA